MRPSRDLLLTLALSGLLAFPAILPPTTRAAAPNPAPAKPDTATAAPDLNRKILAFCAAHLGQQVADGECANLVNEAYKSAGALRRRDVPKPPGVTLRDDDYVWGRLLGPDDRVQPGDVIQFRDVKIVKKTGNRTSTHTAGHHTAVVKSVLGKNHFAVLHQNSSYGVPPEKKKTVHDGDFDFNFKTEGEYWIYRPLPAKAK
jgi:phenylpropionate dioxygenase-like ring-hydroxylating dioxygenase large terminal subunit